MRFLKANEFLNTKDLAAECFGESTDLDEYYNKDILHNRVAVLEEGDLIAEGELFADGGATTEGGEIISMVHLKRVIAEFDGAGAGFEAVDTKFENGSASMWYICYVATRKNAQGRGYMSKLMRWVLDVLKNEGEQFAFLLPVDPSIYKNLGFNFKWKFDSDEADLLYAEEGLKYCYGCALGGKSATSKVSCSVTLGSACASTPIKLRRADTIRDICFLPFDDEACVKYFDFFSIRHNLSYDSVPLDCYIWNKAVKSEYALIDGRCFVMLDKSGEGASGCIPFCKESELVYYFKLMEKYFNEILHLPFSIYLADSEGVEYLKNHGALEGYEVCEDEEIFDYIYSAENLRTLKGRKFSKKRNIINNFMGTYGDRWKYVSLKPGDVPEIRCFLEKWYDEKNSSGGGVNLGEEFDAEDTLEIERDGLYRILENFALLEKVRMGGIYIDEKLCAFALGSYNKKEKMVILEFQKAYAEMTGLYQLINREFFVHEFPEAEIVNLEDDVGLAGLRQFKMSYNPVMFEKRWMVRQAFKSLHRSSLCGI